MPTDHSMPAPPEPLNRRRVILSLIATPTYFAVLLFLPAGSWAWPRGWLFVGVVLALSAITTAYLWRVNPGVVAGRVNAHRGTKGWDRVWIAVLIPVMSAILPVAALDAERFHWSQAPWWVCLIGYLLLTLGFAGFTWAMAVNRFFEPTVRIQTDRGQTVIDTGPYGLVRHPGYVAALPYLLGSALALGSLWALVPAILTWLLIVVRAHFEDRTLQTELPGYREYAQRVRYRLVPGVW